MANFLHLLCPGRVWRLLLGASYLLTTAVAQSVESDSHWQVEFPGSDRVTVTNAVPLGAFLVTVLPTTDEVPAARLHRDRKRFPSTVVASDPVSRLCFLKPRPEVEPRTLVWATSAGSNIGSALRARTPRGILTARGSGRIKQVEGKVLPVALLHVQFQGPVPASGTPLMNEAGHVIGIVLEAAGGRNTAYAISAETVHRVERDIRQHGRMMRGWLGISLNPNAAAPQVVRVWPNSPAAAQGIRPDDVLLRVGRHPITDYADAADAFFYLIPGQAVRLKLLRDSKPLDFTLVPTDARPN